MYSPKDLEGEVDHSFFDSDDGKEQEKDVKEANNSKHQEHNELKQTTAKGKGTSKLGRDGNSEEIREEQEYRESSSGSVKEECSLSASSSSLSSLARSEVSSSNLEGASGSQIKIPEKIRSCSSAEEREDDDESEDGYNRSEEDSEEEPDQDHSRCKSAHHNSSKKVSSKYRNYSPALSSESESSSSESESYTSPRKKSVGLSLSSPRHRSKLYLIPRKDKTRLPEESEDTVTDVTPLSTPDISPVQSFDLAMAKENLKKKPIKKQGNVGLGLYGDSGDYYPDEGEKRTPKTQMERCDMSSPRSGISLASSASLESGVGSRHDQKLLSDAMDLNQLLKACMHLESKTQTNLVIDCPSRKSRKNFSFSNEEVRRVDRENQRLLRELSKPMSKSPSPKKPANPPTRLYHSALNRQREQEKIERENMAFLKRLESVKPTLGLKRSEQLSDYQRQMKYMGSVPSGRMSSAGGSTRSASVASNCSKRPKSSVSTTAVSSPSRAAEARAAWS
ncbi:cilia- and flagella-associated protein 97-like [Huso huso]|uniref:Cilia- and flagella-associated protein 97 n=1 Tax=Huso huso TaxID=61971 RepID=A0ABR1AAV1_HUSHU